MGISKNENENEDRDADISEGLVAKCSSEQVFTEEQIPTDQSKKKRMEKSARGIERYLTPTASIKTFAAMLLNTL